MRRPRPALASRMRAMRRAADHAHVAARGPGRRRARRRPRQRAGADVHRARPAGARRRPAHSPRADRPAVVRRRPSRSSWADAPTEAPAPFDAGGGREPRDGRPRPVRHEPLPARLAAAAPGDLQGAEGDARTRARGAPRQGAPPLYRKLAAAILVNGVDRAGGARARGRAVLDGVRRRRARADAHRGRAAPRARATAPRARGAPTEALADALTAGQIVGRHRIDVPGLPGVALEAPRWPTPRSASAGRACAWRWRRSSSHGRSAPSARSGSPCGRPAPWPAGPRARRSCAKACSAWSAPSIALERARALAELGVLVRATGRRGPRPARCCARRSTSPIARAPRRSPTWPRASCGRRAPSPGASPSAGSRRSTASERRVAELAGDGLTNREIAQALFVTMRTVEGHLTRVFGQARAELARRGCPTSGSSAREPRSSLREHAREVALDRARGDEERLGDLAVGQAVRRRARRPAARWP